MVLGAGQSPKGSPQFSKLCVITTRNDEDHGSFPLEYVLLQDQEGQECPPYTRDALSKTLIIMGCKPRHALKVSKRVFQFARDLRDGGEIRLRPVFTADEQVQSSKSEEPDVSGRGKEIQHTATSSSTGDSWHARERQVVTSKAVRAVAGGHGVSVERRYFNDLVCHALNEYQYFQAEQREDLTIATSIRERRTSVSILLCGTSGTGKSTLASLLAGRLNISTVVSTDAIRNLLRSFIGEQENPLLWASTYDAGDHLDPAVLQDTSPTLLQKKRAVKGYKAQSQMIIENLDRLIGGCEARKESIVVEGVHLSLNFVVQLMQKHPSVIPFVVYISNEVKHRERFAVRAKYMTLEPTKNRYIKYFRNIRTIQEYLCHRADKYLIPKIDNTNLDRSVYAIHSTVFSYMKRGFRGLLHLDPSSKELVDLHSDYEAQAATTTWSSKSMLQVIRRNQAILHASSASSTDNPSTSSAASTPYTSEVEDFDARSFDGDSDGNVSDSDVESGSEGEGPMAEGGGRAINELSTPRSPFGSVGSGSEDGDLYAATPGSPGSHRSPGSPGGFHRSPGSPGGFHRSPGSPGGFHRRLSGEREGAGPQGSIGPQGSHGSHGERERAESHEERDPARVGCHGERERGSSSRERGRARSHGERDCGSSSREREQWLPKGQREGSSSNGGRQGASSSGER